MAFDPDAYLAGKSAAYEPPDYTDRFNTPLSPEQRKAYDAWRADVKKRYGRTVGNDLSNYDTQGFFLDKPMLAKFMEAIKKDGEAHFTDKYKKPNYPTFSDESIYSNAETPGGKWTHLGGDRWSFEPSTKMLAEPGRRTAITDHLKTDKNAVLIAPDEPAADGFDPDAYLAATAPAPDQNAHTPHYGEFPGDGYVPATTPGPTIGERLAAVPETALTLGTAAVGGTAGMLLGLPQGILESLTSPHGADVQQRMADNAAAMTWAPRSAGAQANLETLAPGLEALGAVAPMTGELGAIAQGARPSAVLQGTRQAVGDAAAQGMAMGAGVAQGAQRAAGAVSDGVANLLGEGIAAPGVAQQSVGAAATPETLRRVATAESLPVPITYTRGAATRSAEQLAFEKEQMKGAFGGPLRNRAEENNIQAMDNFEVLIDRAGSVLHDVGPQATGASVLRVLNEGWRAAKNKVKVLYKRANDSPEALALANPAPLIEFLNGKPHGTSNTGVFDSTRQMMVKLGIAADDGAGGLTRGGGNTPGRATVRTMETLRQEINDAVGFDSKDQRQAAILKGMIDDIMEPVAGPLYKAARRARQQQAQKFEDRAVVARLLLNRQGMADPLVATDQVFLRSVLNGSPAEVTRLKRTLLTGGARRNAKLRENGAQAWREIQGAMVKHIQDEATKGMGSDSGTRPIVSPHQLNLVVRSLDKNGRLDIVLGKQSAQIIRDLNEAVKLVNTSPPGTLINSSGTVGTLMAAMAEAGIVGSLTGGAYVPVISGLKFVLKLRKEGATKARIADALNALPTIPAQRASLRRAAMPRPSATRSSP